jgi:hypothetical protein
VQDNAVSTLLHEAFEKYGQEHSWPKVDKLVNSLQKDLSSFKKIFIVVDALDECKEGPQLVKLIQSISDKAHLLFTSRPLETIQSQMEGSTYMEIMANQSDMEKYVSQRVKAAPQFATLIGGSSITIAGIQKAVIDQADGM